MQFCKKLFFRRFSLMLHPNGFLSQALPTLPNWNAFSERLIARLSSSPIPFFFSEASLPLLQVTLTYFAQSPCERALCLSNSFPILGSARLGMKQDSADPPGKLLRPLTRSCFPYFSYGGSLCLPFFTSLELAFLHRGVHLFLCMLTL